MSSRLPDLRRHRSEDTDPARRPGIPCPFRSRPRKQKPRAGRSSSDSWTTSPSRSSTWSRRRTTRSTNWRRTSRHGLPSGCVDASSGLRHDLLHARRHLSATRAAVRRIVDRRLDVGDTRSSRKRSSDCSATPTRRSCEPAEELDVARDLLASSRDHHQAMIAESQNEIVKKLTVIASLVLVPTLHRRLLRTELRGGVRRPVLERGRGDRAHRLDHDPSARALPLAALDLAQRNATQGDLQAIPPPPEHPEDCRFPARPMPPQPSKATGAHSAGSRDDGHRSSSTHSSHRGRRASHTRRPCQMRRCGKRAQSARGHDPLQVALDLHRVVVSRQAEPLREPPHVRVDDDPLRVPELGGDDVGGLARDPGQPHADPRAAAAPRRRTPRAASASCRGSPSPSGGRSPVA